MGPEPGLLPSGSDCGFCSTGWGLLAVQRGGQRRKERRWGRPQPVLRSCQALQFLSCQSPPLCFVPRRSALVSGLCYCPPHSHPLPCCVLALDSREASGQPLRTSCQQRQAKANSSQGLHRRGSFQWVRSMALGQETQESSKCDR